MDEPRSPRRGGRAALLAGVALALGVGGATAAGAWAQDGSAGGGTTGTSTLVQSTTPATPATPAPRSDDCGPGGSGGSSSGDAASGQAL